MKTCRTLGILGLLSLPAHAVVVTTAVDEDNGNALGTNGAGVSLREAVKYSSSGATVTFDPALSGALFRMTIAPLAISRSITIDASSLPQPVVLSGDKNNSGGVPDVGDLTVVTIAGGGNVLLNSVVITGGHHTASGAGIHVSSGELTLRNSTLTGNKGIAIYSLTGPVVIEGSTLSNNTAQAGAAVYTTGPLDIRDSTITGNHASGDAGAIFLNGEGPGIIEDCVISGNTAGSGGGAIRSDGDLEVRRCTFLSNAAETDGGAILAGSGELWVETCTFSGNMAEGNGGGIRSAASLIVSKSTLADNSAAPPIRCRPCPAALPLMRRMA